MNYEPTPQSPEEQQLQEVFDETAALPSDAQLARMSARAQQIPGGGKRRGQRSLLFPVAAAAAVALAIGGGAWWAQNHADRSVASPAVSVPVAPTTAAPTALPTPTPTAVASVEPNEIIEDDSFDDSPALPSDPLAVLDGDFEGGVWMGELDLLHGPADDGDDYWAEMELLMEEGG